MGEVIEPTVGRILWFFETEGAPQLAAIVTAVHGPTLVDVTAFPPGGEAVSLTSIPLVQPGEPLPGGRHCTWMPYQVKKSIGGESGEPAAGEASI